MKMRIPLLWLFIAAPAFGGLVNVLPSNPITDPIVNLIQRVSRLEKALSDIQTQKPPVRESNIQVQQVFLNGDPDFPVLRQNGVINGTIRHPLELAKVNTPRRNLTQYSSLYSFMTEIR